jgi:hypothetical protein
MGVIRDPTRNEPMIEIALGTERMGFRTGVPEELWGGTGKAAPAFR